MKASLIQLEGEIEMRRHISFNLAGKLFDAYAWKDLTDSTAQIIRPTTNPVLLTNNPALLNEFAYRIITLRGSLFFTNRSIATTITSAKNLIGLLKEEYKIK
jgi:hypothetical protein